MQGPRKSINTLPEALIFDNDSALRDSGIDSGHQTRLPEYMIASNETSTRCPPHHLRHTRWNAEWSFGESSSSRAVRTLEERPYEQSNSFSVNNVDVNSNGNQTMNGSFLLQNSSTIGIPHDLNMTSGLGDDDDCQIVERPSSIRSSNGHMPSGHGGYLIDENEHIRDHRISRKRKASEVHAGQSSGVGSSNCFQDAEIPAVNGLAADNLPEQANPTFRPAVGEVISASDFSLSASGNQVSPRRNLRLRINGRHQQDPLPNNRYFTTDTNVGITDASSSRHSSRPNSVNPLYDLNSSRPSILHARRNHQSRWNGSSSSSSTRNSSIPASALYEEPTSRNTRRRISEHPMFVPASETGNSSSQIPANLNLGGGNNIIAGNGGSTSRVVPGTGSHHSFPQYPRRLPEIVQSSLLSSTGTEYEGQVTNHGAQASSSATGMTLTAGRDNNGQHVVNSRSVLLGRHNDGALGIPYSVRNLAGAREGRSSIMSEVGQIREVLNLMRRGGPLRVEDLMMLDHSVLFGMADIRDRHRDMRLDVDNMSYEELLALEERIGNVCTGLNEETIMSRMKQHKYVNIQAEEDKAETEPCSICREEYNEGEDLGKLQCGHDFHKDCIKQWLMQKNLCPICKTTGLTT